MYRNIINRHFKIISLFKKFQEDPENDLKEYYFKSILKVNVGNLKEDDEEEESEEN